MPLHRICASIAFVLQGIAAHAEPSWLPALTYAEPPACPEHVGDRTYKSDLIQKGPLSAVIEARSEHRDSGCEWTAELVTVHGGGRDAIPLSQADKSTYSIVDFSPDGSELLLSVQRLREYPNEGLRSFELATIGTDQHELKWLNAWDLYGWADCDALVEPQGFTSEGSVVVLARPYAMTPRRRSNCVSEWGLYRADLRAHTVTRLPDSLKLQRYGAIARHATEACKSDPDIAGPSFTVHGRLSVWNGSPTLRIWHIGTNRILGVQDGFPPPEEISSKLGLGNEAVADFVVFPFTVARPHEMQIVCIESVGRVIFQNLSPPIGRGQ
jgi:hypothetical protein